MARGSQGEGQEDRLGLTGSSLPFAFMNVAVAAKSSTSDRIRVPCANIIGPGQYSTGWA